MNLLIIIAQVFLIIIVFWGCSSVIVDMFASMADCDPVKYGLIWWLHLLRPGWFHRPVVWTPEKDAKHIESWMRARESGQKVITLWMEGYAVTGNSAGASNLDNIMAYDLDDAVKKYMEKHNAEVEWDYFGRGRHAIWACEIFDNEADARKSFG